MYRRPRGHIGRYSQGPPPAPYEKKEPSLKELTKGLGSEIDTIPVPSSLTGQSDAIAIEDFKPLASYSWLDSKSPTIIVPGSPPIWQDRPLPYTVPRDTGTVFIDQNASRLASSPLLPALAAVSHLAPDFPLHTVDFVTDRNGLRKLWRWAAGDEGAGAFRIDVEVAGRAVLMQRWETERTQPGGPGYEKEFEKASTRAAGGCEGATGHHRIVTFNLGGMNILMRYKADACLPTPPSTDPLDALTSTLDTLSLTPSKASPPLKIPAFNNASLSILSRGTLVPQSSLLELKTRSTKNVSTLNWTDTYPQLLLSQTPHIFICVHTRGTFEEVRKRTLEELEGEGVARAAQEGLRKLVKVLRAVREAVRAEGEGARLGLVCRRGEGMGVYERVRGEAEEEEEGGFLPRSVLEKFRA